VPPAPVTLERERDGAASDGGWRQTQRHRLNIGRIIFRSVARWTCMSHPCGWDWAKPSNVFLVYEAIVGVVALCWSKDRLNGRARDVYLEIILSGSLHAFSLVEDAPVPAAKALIQIDPNAVFCRKLNWRVSYLHACSSKQALLLPPRLTFPPIPHPAVNNLPLAANRAEIEKVRPFIL
jgi:hypothetical protein